MMLVCNMTQVLLRLWALPLSTSDLAFGSAEAKPTRAPTTRVLKCMMVRRLAHLRCLSKSSLMARTVEDGRSNADGLVCVW